MNYEQVLKNILRTSFNSHSISETKNEDYDTEVVLIFDDKKYSTLISVRDDIDTAYFYLLNYIALEKHDKL